MITFLWMLYLTLTIAYSIWIIILCIDYNKLTELPSQRLTWLFRACIFVFGLLWSVWYMYFLH